MEISISPQIQQKHPTSKEGDRNETKPLVKRSTHKGKNCNNKIKGNNLLLKIGGKKRRSKTQVVFYTFLSFWQYGPIAHTSSHTFGPVSYIGFLTEERRKEKRYLFVKVMFALIVHKREVPARSNPGVRIYNHSVKRQHPLLERNWKSVTHSGKDWTCTESVLAIFVWICAHWLCRRVCNCLGFSALLRGRLILCGFILQAALADDGQRVGFCVKHPVLQRKKVIVREEQIQIL